MRKLLNAIFILAFLFLTTPAFADITSYGQGTALGRGEEINFTNGLNATLSGQKFTVSMLGVAAGGASIATGTLPTGNFQVVLNVSNKVGDVMSLANGSYPGQIIEFTVWNRVGSDTEVITPVTSTGWTTGTLGVVGSYLTVEWVNSTTGWVVLGYSATAAS